MWRTKHPVTRSIRNHQECVTWSICEGLVDLHLWRSTSYDSCALFLFFSLLFSMYGLDQLVSLDFSGVLFSVLLAHSCLVGTFMRKPFWWLLSLLGKQNNFGDKIKGISCTVSILFFFFITRKKWKLVKGTN